MYELIALTERAYYIECPARCGVVRTEGNDVVLIDSGSDRDAAKKILRRIEEQGWRLRAVYNTHSHADHIGGNRLLQERTGCRIFARGMEAAFTCHPILEPMTLFGGNPPPALRHKFLLAEPSVCEPLTEECLPAGLSLIPLPGHSYDMVGFLTEDGVAFLGDALSSCATLGKYGVGYLYDVGAHLATLRGLTEVKAQVFLPAHVGPMRDVCELAEYNIAATEGVAEAITELLSVPLTHEVLLSRLFERYGMAMNPVQHALIGSTLRAYLTYLEGEGRVTSDLVGRLLLYRRA